MDIDLHNHILLKNAAAKKKKKKIKMKKMACRIDFLLTRHVPGPDDNLEIFVSY